MRGFIRKFIEKRKHEKEMLNSYRELLKINEQVEVDNDYAESEIADLLISLHGKGHIRSGQSVRVTFEVYENCSFINIKIGETK